MKKPTQQSERKKRGHTEMKSSDKESAPDATAPKHKPKRQKENKTEAPTPPPRPKTVFISFRYTFLSPVDGKVLNAKDLESVKILKKHVRKQGRWDGQYDTRENIGFDWRRRMRSAAYARGFVEGLWAKSGSVNEQLLESV